MPLVTPLLAKPLEVVVVVLTALPLVIVEGVLLAKPLEAVVVVVVLTALALVALEKLHEEAHQHVVVKGLWSQHRIPEKLQR